MMHYGCLTLAAGVPDASNQNHHDDDLENWREMRHVQSDEDEEHHQSV